MVSKYFIWFVLFSFMGWVYETIFCTIRKHRWENRGFLFGPICPIYGCGAVAACIVCSGVKTGNLSDWQIFIICFFGSIVLEYGTSWILEKLFHAIWWDYSKVILNIHGRVCLPASLGFGVAGIIVVRFLLPFAQNTTDILSPVAMEVLALILMGLVAADTALTVSALTSLMQNLQSIEESVNRQMESFYTNIEDNISEKKQSALEKKDELANGAVESMSRLMNLGQKHALHSVKEFHYKDYTSKLSATLIRMEKEVRSKASAAKNVVAEKVSEARKEEE